MALIAELLGLVHHRHRHLLVGREVEGSILGGVLVELLLPVPLEVDGVGQHQPGLGIEHAGSQKILDLLLRLLLDPLVDLLAGRLGVLGEVQDSQFGSVVLAGRLEELGQELVSLLPPEAVRHSKLVALLLVGKEALPQPSHGLVEFRLGHGEVEHLGHLLLGLARCPGIGHRQGGGDAVGREEEVPRGLVLEPGVEIGGELVVSFDDGWHLIAASLSSPFFDLGRWA